MTQQPVPGRLTRVPNQPKTPQRTVRIPDDEWDAAKEAAAAAGETVTDVIRRELAKYVAAVSRRGTPRRSSRTET